MAPKNGTARPTGASRIPPDALERYIKMKPRRSYRILAEEFGVPLRTLGEHASRERWQEKVREIEGEARERLTPPPLEWTEEARQLRERCVETIAEMNARHIQSCRDVHAKCVAALKALPIEDARDAIYGFAEAIKLERLVRGEPTDRHEIAALVKKEAEMFLRPAAEVVEAEGEEIGPRLVEG